MFVLFVNFQLDPCTIFSDRRYPVIVKLKTPETTVGINHMLSDEIKPTQEVPT